MQRSRLTRSRRGAALALLLCLLVGAAQREDPLRDRQYHLQRVRAPEAWDVARGRDQIIAVIDTGVDLDHPDLVGRLVPGVDLVDRGTSAQDENGHGTFVAGVAAANLNNGKGGAGIAPRAKIMPVRVLDEDGKGTSDVVAEGIRWATREGATVINLSLADVPGQRRSPIDLITTDVELAIRQAAMRGIVVVAAAGNEGNNDTPYADDLPALIVGATDRRDGVWEHSNYDERTLFAPGVRIISTYLETPYAAADGTSFSAPMVAAAAALVLQRGLDEEETRRRLRRSARPIGEGEGRVDVAAALGVAPRVRSTPKPQPSEEPSDDGDPEPKQRDPQPVTQPSPVAPEPKKKPRPDKTEPPAVSEPTDPPKKVASGGPPTKLDKGRGDVKPPKAAKQRPNAAVTPVVPPAADTPMWPFIAAGSLLFLIAVGLAGYFAAKNSGT